MICIGGPYHGRDIEIHESQRNRVDFVKQIEKIDFTKPADPFSNIKWERDHYTVEKFVVWNGNMPCVQRYLVYSGTTLPEAEYLIDVMRLKDDKDRNSKKVAPQKPLGIKGRIGRWFKRG